MPRRPPRTRAAAPTAAPTQEQIDARYGEVTSANKLKALLRSAKNTAEQVTTLSGALGEQIANAIEDNHLHRKAFSMIKALNNMSAEKQAELMFHFRKYYDFSGLQERENSVILMPFDPVEPEGEHTEGQSEDPEPAPARVVRGQFPRPASVAAE